MPNATENNSHQLEKTSKFPLDMVGKSHVEPGCFEMTILDHPSVQRQIKIEVRKRLAELIEKAKPDWENFGRGAAIVVPPTDTPYQKGHLAGFLEGRQFGSDYAIQRLNYELEKIEELDNRR